VPKSGPKTMTLGFLTTNWDAAVACMPLDSKPICNNEAFSTVCSLHQLL
jgi:hypothetical protein